MSRLKKLSIKLEEKNVDNFLVSSSKNIYYLTGFYPTTDSYLLYTKGDFILFTTSIDYQLANETIKEIKVQETPLEKSIEQTVAEEIKKLEGNLYFEFSKLTHDLYTRFFKNKKNLQLLNGDEIINSLRIIKESSEIELIKKAVAIGETGLKTAYESIKEGKSEIEVAAEAEYKMRKMGAEGFAFDTIIISGERTSQPHAKTSMNSLKKNDLIIIDLGCIYKGYNSDMTRTFTIGKPADKQIKIYEIVKESQEKAIAGIRAGLQVNEVDAIARNFFKKMGYDRYFIHGLGHGVGLDVHELPFVSFRHKTVLMENNVITIEPGLYIPGWGGIRIEDMILVHKNKGVPLTNLKKDITGL